MSGLKQELGLAQGVGLLSTSLLGTGVFAVPALGALVAGDTSLWAWPALILLVFPIAIVFALLGRHFPSAGGVVPGAIPAKQPTGAAFLATHSTECAEHQSGSVNHLCQRYFHHDLSAVHAGRMSFAERAISGTGSDWRVAVFTAAGDDRPEKPVCHYHAGGAVALFA